MAWTKPCNGKSRINTAGEIMSARRNPTAEISLDVAYDIAGNWRSSHGYPLQIAWSSLKNRARKIDANALVVKRIKRMPSIAAKLARIKTMQLSNMQDLGGCRAVLKNVEKVHELVAYYQKFPAKAFLLDAGKEKDYIAEPKEDGYRGIHLIHRYNRDTQRGVYKGLRIEMQLRSNLQHSWATAVETIDTFTGQGLKSNGGEEDWRRFFLLVSGAFAIMEGCPRVGNVPKGKNALCEELRPICERLHVPNVFIGIASGVHAVESKVPEATKFKTKAYILTLDSNEKKTSVIAFARVKDAERALLILEKENKDMPNLQSVMALSDSVRALRASYPNYFFDTRHFVRLLNFLKLEPEEKVEFIRKVEEGRARHHEGKISQGSQKGNSTNDEEPIS